MKTSELLKEAKKILWDGRDLSVSTFYRICSAIDKACEEVRSGHTQAHDLREEIRSRLGGVCVVTWLAKTANVPLRQITNRNVQAYRHRWLDSLIAEYETQGD